MKRRLFNLAAAVSLPLCLATVGLWVWSQWFASQFYHHYQNESGYGVMAIGTRRGVLIMKRSLAPGLILVDTKRAAQTFDWDVPAWIRLRLFSKTNEHGCFFAAQQRREFTPLLGSVAAPGQSRAARSPPS